jgi:hypothetical protein
VRPLIVIISVLILVATLSLAYFAGPQDVSSGTVTSSTNPYLQVSQTSDMLSFQGTLPLTVSYSHLPSGKAVQVYVCSTQDTQVTCLGRSLITYVLTEPRQSLTVQLASNQYLLVHTVVMGLTYSVTAPVWSLYSTLFVILAVVGLALLIVGLILKPSHPKRTFEPEYQSPGLAPPELPEEKAPPADTFWPPINERPPPDVEPEPEPPEWEEEHA